MTDLEKYEAVNKTDSLEELAEVIRMFTNKEGFIQGRSKEFSTEWMAICCEEFINRPPENLTRQFGIRQQAMYLLHYGKINKK